MIKQVAERLGPLRPKVVFLGGSATGFHITDSAEPEVRATRDVDIIVESTEDAVSVLSFAIFDDKEGNEYVYVVEKGKAKKQKITKGAEGIERTEITDGVKEGEQVIISLEAKGLRDGKKVKIRENETDEKEKKQEKGGGSEEEDDKGEEEAAALPGPGGAEWLVARWEELA